MRLANPLLISSEGSTGIQEGRLHVVRGPYCTRIEPEFIFSREELEIRVTDSDGRSLLIAMRTVSRETIAVFFEFPSLELGIHDVLIYSKKTILLIFKIEVSREVSWLENLHFAQKHETTYFRQRRAIQSLPFVEMLKHCRSCLDSAGSKLVFITGSVGKTTQKELICHLLKHEVYFIKTTDSWNFPHEICSQILLNLDFTKTFVMEAAMGEHMLAMGEFLPPDIFLFINAGLAHTSYSSKLADICDLKASLARKMKVGTTIIYNGSHVDITNSIIRLPSVVSGDANLVDAFSFMQGGGANLFDEGRLRLFDALDTLRIPRKDFNYCDDLTIVSAALAVEAILGNHMRYEAIFKTVHEYVPPPGRLQPILVGDKIVINDAYNSNPTSVGRLLERIECLASTNGKSLLVIGEMADLGEISKNEHEKTLIDAVKVADYVVSIGELYCELGIHMDNLSIFPTINQAKEFLISHTANFDIFAFKGSHSTGIFFLATWFCEQLNSSHGDCDGQDGRLC